MLAIISLLIIMTLSILITRIATIALTHTGLSRETARFQARSAFTGVGFTTSEAEQVVNHPVRRRILHLLMLLGNLGIITAISSLILSFVNPESETAYPKVIFLISGLLLLWYVAQSRGVDRHLSHVISWALSRYSDFEVKDYASILQLAEDYRVSELRVESQDWLADKSLQDLHLHAEGVLVLGIHRAKGSYVGAPNGETEIHSGDTLILYGRDKSIASLDKRQKGLSGDQEHDEAVREQEQVEEQEKKKDRREAGQRDR